MPLLLQVPVRSLWLRPIRRQRPMPALPRSPVLLNPQPSVPHRSLKWLKNKSSKTIPPCLRPVGQEAQTKAAPSNDSVGREAQVQAAPSTDSVGRETQVQAAPSTDLNFERKTRPRSSRSGGDHLLSARHFISSQPCGGSGLSFLESATRCHSSFIFRKRVIIVMTC